MYRFLIFVFVLMIISGCSGKREISEFSPDQKKLLSYIPQDAKHIMYMNTAGVLNTFYWDTYLERSLIKAAPEFWDEFPGKEKEDIIKRLHQFISFRTITGREILIFDFNTNRFLDEVLNRKQIFNPLDRSSGYYISVVKPGMFFRQVDSFLFCAKNRQDLEIYSEERKGDNLELLSGLISQKRIYWIVADNEALKSAGIKELMGQKIYKQFSRIAGSINYLSISAEFKNIVEIESVMNCRNGSSSVILSTAARSAIAMDIFTEQDYNLGEMMDKVKITRNDRNVHFEAALSSKDFNQLVNILDKRNPDQKL